MRKKYGQMHVIHHIIKEGRVVNLFCDSMYETASNFAKIFQIIWDIWAKKNTRLKER